MAKQEKQNAVRGAKGLAAGATWAGQSEASAWPKKRFPSGQQFPQLKKRPATYQVRKGVGLVESKGLAYWRIQEAMKRNEKEVLARIKKCLRDGRPFTESRLLMGKSWSKALDRLVAKKQVKWVRGRKFGIGYYAPVEGK